MTRMILNKTSKMSNKMNPKVIESNVHILSARTIHMAQRRLDNDKKVWDMQSIEILGKETT